MIAIRLHFDMLIIVGMCSCDVHDFWLKVVGSGLFILGMARRRKDLNFLGVEIYTKVIWSSGLIFPSFFSYLFFFLSFLLDSISYFCSYLFLFKKEYLVRCWMDLLLSFSDWTFERFLYILKITDWKSHGDLPHCSLLLTFYC